MKERKKERYTSGDYCLFQWNEKEAGRKIKESKKEED